MPTSETQVYLQVSRRVQPNIDKVNSCQRAKNQACLNVLQRVQPKIDNVIVKSFHKETFILFLQTEFCKTSHSLPFFLVNTSCNAVSLIVNSSMPFIWARLSLNRHARALYKSKRCIDFWDISLTFAVIKHL